MGPSHEANLPKALKDACSRRRQRLAKQLARNHLDALLVSSEKDIHYLTGFVGHDSLLIVTEASGPDGAVIVSDNRYDEFLDPWRQSNLAEIVMGKRHRLPETVRQICDKRSIRRLGLQAEHVTLLSKANLAAAVGEERLTATSGLVRALRMRKDDLEIAAIERAIGIQQDSLSATLNQMTIGMTELEFSALLEFQMKSRGAFGTSFTPIIAAGANSSVPHYMSGSTPIDQRAGVLLVDWGAMVDGYCADMTRTFGIGAMPAKIRAIYPIVLEAQRAAIDAIAPGKICAEIDAVARSVITKAGYGDRFGHGLGHGIGLDIHESPYFNDLEVQQQLEPGMIMTVEPGIYLPDVGGVRIEDDVLVTEDGVRVLSDYPKEPSSTVIEPALSGTR